MGAFPKSNPVQANLVPLGQKKNSQEKLFQLAKPSLNSDPFSQPESPIFGVEPWTLSYGPHKFSPYAITGI